MEAPIRAARLLPIALTSLIPLVAACDDNPAAPVIPVATTVEIEPATATLTAIGEVVRLSATVLDQNGEPMPAAAIEWESLDASVATVTGAGAVVAHAAGTAPVEARSGSVGELATVTVAPVPTSVAVEPAADTLNALGDIVPLTATVQDPNGVTLEDAVVNWASTDSAVATVDGAGRVAAVAPGTATISATAGETTVEASVLVRQVAAAVQVSPASITLAENESEALSAVVVDSNGVQVAGADVDWNTDDPLTATVDGDGLATGVFQGVTEITASSGGATGTATARVLGRISFSAGIEEAGDIVYTTVVMNADGTGVDTLDFLGTTDRTIVWSPGRSRIAFVSERSGDVDIWVANADGSGTPMNLTNDAAFDTEPAWSPDGERIAFRSDAGGDNDVWIANADGSGTPTNVIDNPFASGQPAWSPDGLSLALAQENAADGNLEIAVTDPDAETPFLYGLTNPDSALDDRYPAWSPDSRRIAFTRGPFDHIDLYVVDVDGTNLRRLTQTPASETAPSWSPDGRRIVYTSARDGNGELYIVDLATGEEQRLTRSRVNELAPQYLPRP